MYYLDNLIAKRKTKDIFKEKDKVIKLFEINYSKAQILNEALNHARIEEATNLNIPKLYEVTQIKKRWAIVIENIKGNTIEELIINNPDMKDFYLELFVNAQIEMFSKKVPLLNDFCVKSNRKIQNSNLDENLKYEICEKLDSIPKNSNLCHGDFCLSNVIVDKENRVFIIDWSHATNGNKLFDVVNTYLILDKDDKNLAKKYLDLFMKKTNTKLSQINEIIQIVAALRYEMATKEEQKYLEKYINISIY